MNAFIGRLMCCFGASLVVDVLEVRPRSAAALSDESESHDAFESPDSDSDELDHVDRNIVTRPVCSFVFQDVAVNSCRVLQTKTSLSVRQQQMMFLSVVCDTARFCI